MSTNIAKQYVTTIPLVQFVSGFLISFVMEWTASRVGKTVVFGGGCILNILIGLLFGYLQEPGYAVLMPVAVLIGFGTSTTIIQTYAMAAEVFGQDEQTSGFCFGVMGVIEKFTNGGVIIAIQGLYERLVGNCGEDCPITAGEFYKLVFRKSFSIFVVKPSLCLQVMVLLGLVHCVFLASSVSAFHCGTNRFQSDVIRTVS